MLLKLVLWFWLRLLSISWSDSLSTRCWKTQLVGSLENPNFQLQKSCKSVTLIQLSAWNESLSACLRVRKWKQILKTHIEHLKKRLIVFSNLACTKLKIPFLFVFYNFRIFLKKHANSTLLFYTLFVEICLIICRIVSFTHMNKLIKKGFLLSIFFLYCLAIFCFPLSEDCKLGHSNKTRSN